MAYHVMTSSRSGGVQPLTANRHARSVGSIYNTHSALTPSEAPEAADVYPDPGYDDTTYFEDEEANKKKKMMMIAGGVGAVVLIAGIAVVATRN